MLFLQYIMINLALTNSSGLKRHVVALTAPIFAVSCVSHRPLWLSGAVEYQLSPHPSPHPPPARISLWITHLSRPWADSPTDLWAIQPTCREITDFKKAVSQRVNLRSAAHISTDCICTFMCSTTVVTV